MIQVVHPLVLLNFKLLRNKVGFAVQPAQLKNLNKAQRTYTEFQQ